MSDQPCCPHSCPHCGLPLGEEPFDPHKEFFPQTDRITTTHWYETKFTFGKYQGEKVQDILKKDPGYINWVRANVDYVTFSNEVLDELSQALEAEAKKRENRPRRTRFFDDDRDWDHGNGLFDEYD